MVVDCVKVQVKPENIAFVNWVMEGYEYLGVVSTIDRDEGILIVRSTVDMLDDLKAVLASFDFSVQIINS